MATRKLPNSLRKFLRKEKARIRRGNESRPEEQIKKLILQVRKDYGKQVAVNS